MRPDFQSSAETDRRRIGKNTLPEPAIYEGQAIAVKLYRDSERAFT